MVERLIHVLARRDAIELTCCTLFLKISQCDVIDSVTYRNETIYTFVKLSQCRVIGFCNVSQ